MTRSPHTLKQHLLTRSDLAAMAIPAAEVFRWLASSRIDQVGELPGDDAQDDPVFTVLDDALRAELLPRLRDLGKTAVVLTPTGVRAFLLRMLVGTPSPAGDPIIAPARSGAADGESDLAAVMRAAAMQAAAEHGESAVATAREPASQLETAGLQSEGEPAADDDLPADLLDGDDGADGECFDFDALTEQLGGLDAPEAEPETDAETELDPGLLDPPVVLPRSSKPDPETPPVDTGTATPPPAAIERGRDAAEPTAPEAEPVAPEVPAAAIAGELDLEPQVDNLARAVADVIGQWDTLGVNSRRKSNAGDVRRDERALNEEELQSLAGNPLGASPVPATSGFVAAEAVVEQMHEFLVQLRETLVALAGQRDAGGEIEALVGAVDRGFERTAEQIQTTNDALSAIGDRIDDAGGRLSGMMKGTLARRGRQQVRRSGRQRGGAVATGIALLAGCWAMLFWAKAGSPELALGTLLVANAVACFLLLARPR